MRKKTKVSTKSKGWTPYAPPNLLGKKTQLTPEGAEPLLLSLKPLNVSLSTTTQEPIHQLQVLPFNMFFLALLSLPGFHCCGCNHPLFVILVVFYIYMKVWEHGFVLSCLFFLVCGNLLYVLYWFFFCASIWKDQFLRGKDLFILSESNSGCLKECNLMINWACGFSVDLWYKH